MSLTIPKTILLLCAASTIYTLWIQPYQTGLLDAMLDLGKPGAILPGPRLIPVCQHYTGVSLYDKQIATMVGFFWPGVEGSRVDIALVLLELMVQVDVAWVLVVIESLRAGNQGKWYITSAMITGFLMQNIGFALITPLWMYLHLAYSPTATTSTPSAAVLASNNPLPLLTLPISVSLALFLPNVLMALPVPSRLSPDYAAKQSYTGLIQFWPFLLAACQFLLPIIVSAGTSGVQALSERDKQIKSLKYLRRCYAFALFAASMGHLTAFGIPLLAHIFPTLFNPAYLQQLELSNIFIPKSPLPPIQLMTSVSDSVMHFLHWDLLTGSTAVLVWAIALRVQAQERSFWAYEWVEGLVKVAALTVASGPVGAAVAIMWERDELVFAREFGRDKSRVVEKKDW